MQKHTEPITRFDGQFAFLSNFSPHPVVWKGKTWPTVEHAFQACKTEDEAMRETVRRASTPGKAKRLGRKVTMRPHWEVVKVAVMRELVRRKFLSDREVVDFLFQYRPGPQR